MINGRVNQQLNQIFKNTYGKTVIYPSASWRLYSARANQRTSCASKRRWFSFWQVRITTSTLTAGYRRLLRRQKRLSCALPAASLGFCSKINGLDGDVNLPSGLALSDIKAADKTNNLLSNTNILFVGLIKLWYIPRYAGSTVSNL